MEFQDMAKLEFPIEIPEGDKLGIMLKMQKDVNSRFFPIVMQKLRMGTKYSKFNMSEKEELSKEYLLAIMRECSEALDLINSKPWKKSTKVVDVENFKYEIIDIQHFINTLYDIWEMDENEVIKYYIAKNQENNNRIKRSY